MRPCSSPDEPQPLHFLSLCRICFLRSLSPAGCVVTTLSSELRIWFVARSCLDHLLMLPPHRFLRWLPLRLLTMWRGVGERGPASWMLPDSAHHGHCARICGERCSSWRPLEAQRIWEQLLFLPGDRLKLPSFRKGRTEPHFVLLPQAQILKHLSLSPSFPHTLIEI